MALWSSGRINILVVSSGQTSVALVLAPRVTRGSRYHHERYPDKKFPCEEKLRTLLQAKAKGKMGVTQGRRCLHPRIHDLSRSATLAINERSDALRRVGKRIYKCSLGRSPFPVPTEVINILNLHAHEKESLSMKGLPTLWDVAADFHRRKDPVDAQLDDVLVDSGLGVELSREP